MDATASGHPPYYLTTSVHEVQWTPLKAVVAELLTQSKRVCDA